VLARPLVVVLVASPLLAARAARAQDDGATAAAIVAQLERPDRPDARLTAGPLARAKEAIDRAARLRRAGDEAHAKAADGLAREWAETARDLARAADAEAKAADLRRKAVAADAQLERTRALVAEGVARVGRLRAELDEVGRGENEKGARRAVEVHAPDKDAQEGDKPAAPAPPAGAARGGGPTAAAGGGR